MDSELWEEEKFEWLYYDKDNVINIIWADDLFYPPDNYEEYYEGETEEKRSPPITEMWVNEFKTASSSQYGRESPTYYRRIIACREKCEKLKVNFGLANLGVLGDFAFVDKIEDTSFYLVIDAYDKFEGNYNGIELIDEKNIPKNRVIIATRYHGDEDMIKSTVGLDNKYTFRSKENIANKLVNWIASIRRHDNAHIAQALQMYSAPWERDWSPGCWHHDSLQVQDSNHIQYLAEWLNLPVEEITRERGSSAKALVAWPHQNDRSCAPEFQGFIIGEDPPYRNTRLLKGTVFNATLRRLGFSEYSLQNEIWYPVPCQPFLPFLVSLKSFLLEEGIEKYGVPDFEGIQRFDSTLTNCKDCTVVITLSLPSDAPPWGLADSVLGDDRSGTLWDRLRDVLHARTTNIKEQRTETDGSYPYLKPFLYESEDNSHPVVGVSFEPGYLHFTWNGQVS